MALKNILSKDCLYFKEEMKFMKCPYCGEEMEQGVIQSPHEIAWKNKRSYIGTAKFHKGSIILSKLAIFEGSAVTANCCHKCEKIIIDYKDGSCDMNKAK